MLKPCLPWAVRGDILFNFSAELTQRLTPNVIRPTNLENLNKGDVMTCPSRIFLVTLLLPRKVIGEAIEWGRVKWRGEGETSLLTLWHPPTRAPMSDVPSSWGPWIL